MEVEEIQQLELWVVASGLMSLHISTYYGFISGKTTHIRMREAGNVLGPTYYSDYFAHYCGSGLTVSVCLLHSASGEEYDFAVQKKKGNTAQHSGRTDSIVLV